MHTESKYVGNEGYVVIDEIKTKDQLIEKIKKEVNIAFKKFVSKHKLPTQNPKIVVQEIDNGKTNLLYLTPKPIEKHLIGCLENCLDSAHISFCNGKRIDFIEHRGELHVNPFIWITIYLHIELQNHGDKKSMPYMIDGSCDVYYDVINARFLTDNEYHGRTNDQK